VTPRSAREADSPGRLALIYVAFVVLVLLYTWPLVLNLATDLRQWHDVHYFVWSMGWVAERVFTAPGSLFDANIFYPHGLSLAYSDAMLVPAVTIFAPVYGLSRNPILAYNVTVVLFQALAGWAGYYASRQLTGSAAGGWVAGIAFALSPIRSGYYHFAHMQLSFAMPLAFLAFARFLELGRARDLAWALLFVWCQMVTVMYFGIPLIVLLALLTVGVCLLRPCRPRLRVLGVVLAGAVALALTYSPIAWPYLVARSEMGFERDLSEAGLRAADFLTYLDAGRESRIYKLADSGTHPAMFPGFTVYALLLAAFTLAPRRPLPSLSRAAVWTRRALGGSLAATLAAIAAFLVTGGGVVWVLGVRLRMTELDRAVVLMLVLGATWLAVEGYAWARAGHERSLSPREWTTLLALLAGIFVLLSLGPEMNLAGRPVGTGIYTWLYEIFPPWRALRITHRIGFTVMLLAGLLAAVGLSAFEARLAGTRLRRATAIVPLLLLVEYLPLPFDYEVIRWNEPPAAYPWLAQQPGDFAVAEWPAFKDLPDATYAMWSLIHGKRLVNGTSGFDPPFIQETRVALSRLPETRELATIRSIYPLRFLLVHLNRLEHRDERERWERFAQAPPAGLRVAGRLGDTITFEVTPEPEQSRRWERTFSRDLVIARPRARVDVALLDDDPQIEPTVAVDFNGRRLTELALKATPAELEIPLRPPYPRVDRSLLKLELTYRLRPHVSDASDYAIGRTGVRSPVDLVVTSAGKEHGWAASIEVNGVDLAPNRRGYNVVVVDPRSGRVEGRDVFDTFLARAESARLADFVARVPAGSIVAAAIRDDGVGQLTDEAVQALRSLGGQVDPRGALFVSHLVVGVKGAPPGTAVEAFGHTRLARVIGRERNPLLVTHNFRLE
jgi:hypothetical protein